MKKLKELAFSDSLESVRQEQMGSRVSAKIKEQRKKAEPE